MAAVLDFQDARDHWLWLTMQVELPAPPFLTVREHEVSAEWLSFPGHWYVILDVTTEGRWGMYLERHDRFCEIDELEADAVVATLDAMLSDAPLPAIWPDPATWATFVAPTEVP